VRLEKPIRMCCMSLLPLLLLSSLNRSYRVKAFGTPTCGEIFSQSMLAYVPTCIREFLGDHVPSHKLLHARTAAKLATCVAKSLVDSRTDALLRGRSNRDIMSLLGKFTWITLDVALWTSFPWPVRANASENQKVQLNEEELLAQMRYVL
jgi:hypothetical protein